MPDIGTGFLLWAAALMAGGLLGCVYFGGLWWTVRRGALSPTPARWFLGSLVLRTAIVLAGFYVIGAHQPILLGLCLLGFLLARTLVLRVTRVSSEVTGSPCA